jgi:hypothetical protein
MSNYVLDPFAELYLWDGRRHARVPGESAGAETERPTSRRHAPWRIAFIRAGRVFDWLGRIPHRRAS